MSTDTDMDVLGLVAFTAANLNEIDNSTIMHSSNGPAKRLNPHNFVKRPLVASQQQANKYNIKDPNMIEPTKTKPLPPEHHGTVEVDIASLLIPEPDFVKQSGHHQRGGEPRPTAHLVHPAMEVKAEPQIETTMPEHLEVKMIELEKSLSKIEKKVNKILKSLKGV